MISFAQPDDPHESPDLKPGDRVLCIIATLGTEDREGLDSVKEGKIYTVRKYIGKPFHGHPLISLMERSPNHFYRANRFTKTNH
jgi:hypothetical protein